MAESQNVASVTISTRVDLSKMAADFEAIAAVYLEMAEKLREQVTEPAGEPELLCEVAYGPDRLTCSKPISHEDGHGQPMQEGQSS